MTAELNELVSKGASPSDLAFVAPAIVATVVEKDGKMWQCARGVGHDEDDPVTGDHVFWLASLSKLMCTIAALQTVERGLIGLDDDVKDVLPELAALEVLDGSVDEHGVPSTKPRQNKITLRTLLSHSSGVGSESFPPTLAAWANATGLPNKTLDSDQQVMLKCPLAFEPGTGWTYGEGIDWAGEAVRRLNGLSLEDYYRKNIWGPLGMTRSTFHPLQFGQYIIQPYQRQADGGVKAGPLVVPRDAPVEMAGHGVWSTPNDHAKLLSALLRGGAPILSTKSVDEIFTPQLPDPKHLEAELHGFLERVLAPTIPRSQPVNHGLGGVVNLKDFPARRSAGTLQWVGAANQFWWIDRTKGVAASTFFQLIPAGDAKANAFNNKFEEAVYRSF